MEYFYSGGGNNRPYFVYRFKVNKCTNDMYLWASEYPSNSPFSRFHIEWGSIHRKKYDVIQFELRDAAKIFRVAFAGEYEEITMKEYISD